MTDTLMGMLTAARALHERNPNDPLTCETCSTNDRYTTWPCATAWALGATGYSEWATPEPKPCGEIRTEPDDNINREDGFIHYPCVIDAGHTSKHYDRDNDSW